MGPHLPGKLFNLVPQQGDLLGQKSFLRFIIGKLNGNMDQDKEGHDVEKKKKGRRAIIDTQPVGHLVHDGMKKRQDEENPDDTDPQKGILFD
jgi:hypothetical protein